MKTSVLKISRKLPGLISIIVIALLFQACSGERKADPVADYSENGVALSQMTIKVFTDLNEKIKNQAYQKEFIKIVNDLSPETYIMKSESDHSVELENMYKINALRNLERVYIGYNLQLDPNISPSSVDLQGKINAACYSLDSLELSESLSMKNEQIKVQVKSSKFRIDETIFQLTDLFAEFWSEESQKWFLMLANYLEETDKGIKKIPTNVFNAEKLKTLVDEPYNSGAVLANLYKLKMLKENQIQISDLQNQIQTVSEAFSLILVVQGELMKRKGDKLKVQELNNRLSILLAK